MQGALKSSPNLVRLVLAQVTLDDSSLLLLTERAHKLKSLSIGCQGYSSEAVIALAQRCHQLQHLELLPNALASLQLNRVNGISQSALISFLSVQHGLLEADLAEMEISDDFFRALAENCLPDTLKPDFSM